MRRWLKVKQKDWTVDEDRWRRRISLAGLLADRRRAAPRGRPRAALGSRAVTLLTELDAFFTEHQRCGDLDAGVDGPVVWFDCECGARIARRADDGDAFDVDA
jgi:hypothetical protein